VADPTPAETRREAEQILTLPEIARRTGGEYRTLFNWRNRGILTPSVQQANGSGTRDLFSQRDAAVAGVLVRLRKRGLGIEGVAAVAKLLAEHDRVLCPACDSKPINLATLDHKGDTDAH